MIQAICWTLIHSLWQGLFFAVITGLVMLLTRQARAAVRYNLLCVLFFLFLGVCAGTFVYEWMVAAPMTKNGVIFSAAESRGWVTEWIGALGRYCSDHALSIVWVWLFVFAIKSLHMLGNFLYTQRIRHYGIRMAPEGWQEKVDDLGRQMGIRRVVRLVESQIVKMPLVIGYWRPMIFIPLGLITGLPGGEIEAVLLHELAHIRRNDYIVNFLQNAAVNLLFFNPGFLWISALLSEERENCCDDIAVARIHNKAEFVRALISFKEHDLRLAGLGNAFPAGKNQLVKRVRRIAQNTNKTLDPIEKIFLVVSFVLISLLVAGTGGNAPAAPINVAQMQKGNYRIIIDTPVMAVRPVLEKKNIVIPVSARVRPVMARKMETGRREFKDREEAYAADAAIAEKENLDESAKQSLRDKGQALLDKEQARRDEDQAKRDSRQAQQDKAQADRDAQQAIRDREQAERDAKQAVRDKEQADRDRAQAEKRRADQDSQKKHISP